MAQSFVLPRIRPLPMTMTIALAAGLTAAPGSALAAASDPAMAAEMAALRGELARLQARLEELEARTQKAAAPSQPAATVSVEAGPGLDIESSDGERSFSIGGRLHYDLYAHDSGRREATGGTEFRRARVHVDGAAAGWNYRVQVELAGGNVDLRDVYVERELAGGTMTIGQFKPFRSLEELTSSNDISVMERGFTSASGLLPIASGSKASAGCVPCPPARSGCRSSRCARTTRAATRAGARPRAAPGRQSSTNSASSTSAPGAATSAAASARRRWRSGPPTLAGEDPRPSCS